VDIDLAIREQLRREVRQQRAQMIVSRSLTEHRTARRSGQTVLVANMRMMDSLREGLEPVIYEYSDMGDTGRERDKGYFARAYDATMEAGLEWGFTPMVNSLLSSMGLDRNPALRSAVSRVITTAMSNILRDPSYRLYSLNCKDVSRALAEATAEALPEAIFDNLVQGSPVPKQLKGVMLTIRETIGNFFKDQRVIRKITKTISDFVCNVDLSDLFLHGKDSLESSIRSSLPGSAEPMGEAL